MFIPGSQQKKILTVWLIGVLVAGRLTGMAASLPVEKESPDAEELHKPVRRSGPLNPPAPPKAGEPINDKALIRYLEIEGLKLVEGHKTLAHWQDDLGRKTCQLKLPSPGTRKLSAEDVARRAESAVVVVGTFFLCGRCANVHLATASGFFLNESGALATCRHVLDGNATNGQGVVVLTRDGRLCAVREILACDPMNDLIILQVEGKGFTPLPLSTNVAMGAPVTLVSHPENHYYMTTTGVFSRRTVQRRKDGLVEFLTITADFAKGSSGAPVCNEAGAAVGLVNNTESIYYNVDHGQPVNFQMTVKNCTPAQALLGLVKSR